MTWYKAKKLGKGKKITFNNRTMKLLKNCSRSHGLDLMIRGLDIRVI